MSIEDLDMVAVVAAEERPPWPDRPWVVVNMVASVDGASADPEGRSAGLSGPADRALFFALRSVADVIMAGAGTVRAENYGPPRLSEPAAAARADRKQAPLPRLAAVTASLRLDPAARFFQEAPGAERPLIVTAASPVARAGASSAETLSKVAEMVIAGEETVDWKLAMRLLRQQYDTGVLLVEGGPTLNTYLVDNDLVDELCLTVAPVLLGGTALRIVAGAGHARAPVPLRLARVFEDDGFLLLRYLRDH